MVRVNVRDRWGQYSNLSLDEQPRQNETQLLHHDRGAIYSSNSKHDKWLTVMLLNNSHTYENNFVFFVRTISWYSIGISMNISPIQTIWVSIICLRIQSSTCQPFLNQFFQATCAGGLRQFFAGGIHFGNALGELLVKPKTNMTKIYRVKM